jgi:trigger factor
VGSSPSARTKQGSGSPVAPGFRHSPACLIYTPFNAHKPSLTMPTINSRTEAGNLLLITVTLSREEIEARVNNDLKKFRNRAGIKGFRQGHAPIQYVKKMFGPSVLIEAFNDMMASELQKFLQNTNLNFLGQPLPTEGQQLQNLKLDQLEPEYTLEYEIGLLPDFEVQGLDAGQYYEKLTPADVDTMVELELDNALLHHGVRIYPEEDIQEKDMIRINAKEVDGDWETTLSTLVENITDPDLKAEVLGKKKGDSIRFNARSLDSEMPEPKYRKYILRLPEEDDRQVGDWFEGVIEEVVRTEKAALDEDFFQKQFYGAVTNAEEARNYLKQNTLTYYNRQAETILNFEIRSRLLALNPVELPETFLKRWLEVSDENKLSREMIEREFPAFAQDLIWNTISKKIEEKFDLEVTEWDIRAAIMADIRQYLGGTTMSGNMLNPMVERMMENREHLNKTYQEVRRKKIFQAIYSAVTIQEKPVSSEEFNAIMQEAVNKVKTERPKIEEPQETAE